MFNGTAGSMYEEIEEARRIKLRKRKIMRKRITAIVILLIIVSYLLLLLNDIRRYFNGEHPLITISYSSKDYDDGKVETYYSIGWLFRYYTRETINDTEIKPFWSPIRFDSTLNRFASDPNLPEIDENYVVPDNISKQSKVNGVLFFYDKDENLLGTYKCLLSENDCEIALSSKEDDDKQNRPSNIQMSIIENRYVFVADYKSKNTQAEEKHIYLYDIVAKHIIAQYQDVRYTVLERDEDNKMFGTIDSSKYIVKKNDRWGIDEVIKGKVANFEDYKYKYINYDEENKLYIFKDETNQWIVMNANTRAYSSPITETIDSLYYKNDKIYIIAYVKNENTLRKTYYLYNQDAVNVLSKDDIDDLKAYDKFLAYTKDDYLYIIDYDGKEVISKIKLEFTISYTNIKPYTIKLMGNTLIISTPKEQSATHLTTEYYYNMEDWTLIRTRDNVKETT
ncbi:MAG: hypothetical protein IJ572_01355 [Bacilli bacterium]|nr:hypothetical protein [Bacilli bacterium]